MRQLQRGWTLVACSILIATGCRTGPLDTSPTPDASPSKRAARPTATPLVDYPPLPRAEGPSGPELYERDGKPSPFPRQRLDVLDAQTLKVLHSEPTQIPASIRLHRLEGTSIFDDRQSNSTFHYAFQLQNGSLVSVKPPKEIPLGVEAEFDSSAVILRRGQAAPVKITVADLDKSAQSCGYQATPDGKTVLLWSSSDDHTFLRLIPDIDHPEVKSLGEPLAAKFWQVQSSKHYFFALVTEGRKSSLIRIDPSNGSVTPHFIDLGEDIEVDCSPESEKILFGGKKTFMADESSGRQELTWDLPFHGHLTHFLANTELAISESHFLNLASGELLPVPDGLVGISAKAVSDDGFTLYYSSYPPDLGERVRVFKYDLRSGKELARVDLPGPFEDFPGGGPPNTGVLTMSLLQSKLIVLSGTRTVYLPDPDIPDRTRRARAGRRKP